MQLKNLIKILIKICAKEEYLIKMHIKNSNNIYKIEDKL